LKTRSNIPSESKLRSRAGVDIPGKAYSGNKTSRAEIYSDDDEIMSDGQDESKSEMDSSDGDQFMSDDEPKTDRQEVSSEDEDQEDIDQKLKELGQQEKNMVRQLSKVAKGSIEKGHHVRNQQVRTVLTPEHL
jgi:glutamine synthetase adenylyltransferase